MFQSKAQPLFEDLKVVIPSTGNGPMTKPFELGAVGGRQMSLSNLQMLDTSWDTRSAHTTRPKCRIWQKGVKIFQHNHSFN